jgi:Zn-finger domain-containing protein
MSAVITGKHAGTSAPAAAKRTRIVELPDHFGPMLDELSEVSLARAEAERREKEIKEAIKAEAGVNLDKLETLVVKVAGRIRAKIGLRGRDNANLKLLREAFPEAYASVVTESEYQVVSPA